MKCVGGKGQRDPRGISSAAQVDRESRLPVLRTEEGFTGERNFWGRGVAVGRNKRGAERAATGN